MKFTALLYVVFVLLAGCGKEGPREPYCSYTESGVRAAAAYRECSEAGKCWISAKDYAFMRGAEAACPWKFETSIER